MARTKMKNRPQGSKRCMTNHVKMLSEEIEKAKARYLLAWAYLRAVKTGKKEIPSYVRDAQKAMHVQQENLQWILTKINNLQNGFCVFDGDFDGRKGYPLSEVEQEVVNALPQDFFIANPPLSSAPPRLDSSIRPKATATPAEGCELESRGIKRQYRSGLLQPKNRPGSGASFQPAQEEIADCEFEHGRRAATLEKAKPPHVALQLWMSFGCVPSSRQALQLQEGHKIKKLLHEGKTVSWINASLLELHPWVQHGDRCHYEPVMDAEKLKLLDIVFCEVQPSKQFRADLICQIVRRRGGPCFYISDFQGHEKGHCYTEHIYGKLTHVSGPHV